MAGDIRKILYGFAIASFSMIIIILFMAEGNDKYGSDYNDTNIDTYNKLDEINDISENIRNKEGNTTISSNPLDVLGGLFKSGYQSLRLTKATVDIADEFVEKSVDDAQIGESGKYLKILLGLLLVFAIIGGLIAILVNRDW